MENGKRDIFKSLNTSSLTTGGSQTMIEAGRDGARPKDFKMQVNANEEINRIEGCHIME